MNDGSASVFYAIFGLRFLYEMGIPGIGEHVGWGKDLRSSSVSLWAGLVSASSLDSVH